MMLFENEQEIKGKEKEEEGEGLSHSKCYLLFSAFQKVGKGWFRERLTHGWIQSSSALFSGPCRDQEMPDVGPILGFF